MKINYKLKYEDLCELERRLIKNGVLDKDTEEAINKYKHYYLSNIKS